MAKLDKDKATTKESLGAYSLDPSASAAPARQAAQDPEPDASDARSSRLNTFRWSGGTWKGKTAAVAQIDRESISADASTRSISGTSDQSSSKTPATTQSNPSSPAPAKHLSSRFTTPSKSSPTTKLSISAQEDTDSSTEKPAGEIPIPGSKTSGVLDGKEGPQDTESSTANEKAASTPGWLGWWGGNKIDKNDTNMPSSKEKEDSTTAAKPSKPSTENQPTSLDSNKPAAKSTSVPSNSTGTDLQQSSEATQSNAAPDGTLPKSTDRSRASWFGLWGTGSGEGETAMTSGALKSSLSEPTASNVASDGYTALVDEVKAVSIEAKKPDQTHQPSSSWAFWSRDTSTATPNSGQAQTASKSEAGELAVANTKSESDPKPVNLPEEQQKKLQASSPKPDSKKRERPESMQSKDDVIDGKKQKSEEQKTIEKRPASAPVSGDESSQTGVEPPSREGETSLRKKLQKTGQNQLLPPLHETFRKTESPSYFQQLFRLFGRAADDPKKYLSLNPSQPKVRKALAIGVHGYFPGALVARVIGQPTGTSIRFASGAASAIQKWADDNNCPCEVEKIALEGEGMIDARVDTLWKLLLNWIDKIRNADVILVACHSQGVPVSAILLSRLINFGCLSPNARVGLCAMAGINLGPFSSYQSRILSTGTTSELFEFSRSQSPVSKAYASALATCLQNHVRIVYIGSIDDQLVSLESSLFATASHPYIYRAVFVDGRIHAPGFLTNLVGLACKLRNLGVSDHGLIRELSGPLAGSLYTGEGHSRIYEDQSVYELAVQHTLETSTLTADVPIELKDYEVPSTASANPYFLPWAMRGVLEEEFVRTELKADTDDLIKRFETWKPASKVLKDVKFRLEAVRSKL